MRKTLLTFLFAASFLAAADMSFTGTITDSMCGKDHSSMNMGSDAKCTDACVKAGAKFVLLDGAKVYTLSDQKAPAKFAGQKVTVTGTEKSGTITVAKIEAAK